MATNLIVAGQRVSIVGSSRPCASLLWKDDRAERLAQLVERKTNGGLDPVEFVHSVMSEIAGLPEDTDPRSVVECAFNCAYLGLLPGKILGHAHFVPFRERRGERKVPVATLIVGYKGYLTLSFRNEHLAGLTTEVIFAGEKSRRWNDHTGAHLEHEIPFDDRPTDLSKALASYCLYTTKGGVTDVVTVPGSELRGLQKRQGNVWNEFPIAMAQKTAIRRAAKRWNITSKPLGAALHLEDMTEADQRQPCLAHQEAGLRVEDDTPALTLSDAPEPPAARYAIPAWAQGSSLGDRLAAAKTIDEVSAAVKDVSNSLAKTPEQFDALQESGAARIRELTRKE